MYTDTDQTIVIIYFQSSKIYKNKDRCNPDTTLSLCQCLRSSVGGAVCQSGERAARCGAFFAAGCVRVRGPERRAACLGLAETNAPRRRHTETPTEGNLSLTNYRRQKGVENAPAARSLAGNGRHSAPPKILTPNAPAVYVRPPMAAGRDGGRHRPFSDTLRRSNAGHCQLATPDSASGDRQRLGGTAGPAGGRISESVIDRSNTGQTVRDSCDIPVLVAEMWVWEALANTGSCLAAFNMRDVLLLPN